MNDGNGTSWIIFTKKSMGTYKAVQRGFEAFLAKFWRL